MITDKEKVLSMYPNAVAESFYHFDGRVIWSIWSIPKDIGTTKRCRYLLGAGANETLAWHIANIGVENARQLMADAAMEVANESR